jgi:antitoxin VapB
MGTKATAKVFKSGRSQAVRLPKEFRFSTDIVFVHREGNAVILEAADVWPEGYFEAMKGFPDDVERPSEGVLTEREEL